MTVGMLFLFTGFYFLLPTLPMFIKQMGGNESQVGLAVGAFMLSAVIFRPIVGGLLDRFGRRPFIVWGLLLFTFAMYMYDWVGGILVLMGLRILHGMSWAVSTTAVFTAVRRRRPCNDAVLGATVRASDTPARPSLAGRSPGLRGSAAHAP